MWEDLPQVLRVGSVLNHVDVFRLYEDAEQLLDNEERRKNLTWEPHPLSLKGDCVNSQTTMAVVSNKVSVTESATKGRCVTATESISAGTLIVVETPIVGMFDTEAAMRYPTFGQLASTETDILALQFAKFQDAKSLIKSLHPRLHTQSQLGSGINTSKSCGEEESDEEGSDDSGDECSTGNPDSSGESGDEDKESQYSAMRETIHAVLGDAADLMKAKTSMNSMRFDTNSEQYCFPLRYQSISGAGLYLVGSNFNHSCCPNVARFSIADTMCFVVTRDTAANEELEISYLGHHELAMSTDNRQREMSDRDFVCTCSRCLHKGDQKRPTKMQATCSLENYECEAMEALETNNFMEAMRTLVHGIRFLHESVPDTLDEQLVSLETFACMCTLGELARHPQSRIELRETWAQQIIDESTRIECLSELSKLTESSDSASSSKNEEDTKRIKHRHGGPLSLSTCTARFQRVMRNHQALFGAMESPTSKAWYMHRYRHEVRFLARELMKAPHLEGLFWAGLRSESS